jgi:NADPH:quinone reductase-like Zn-dependent oxidoreductase
VRSGERLLVHAVGSSVGVASLSLGKALGATVAGSSRSPWKLDRANALGLDTAIHVESVFHPSKDLTAWADVIMELVGGGYLPGDLTAAAPGARLILVGLTGGRNADMDLGAILSKRMKIIGTTLRNRSDEAKTALMAALARDVVPLFADGRIRPVVDRAFPMTEAAAAHRHVSRSSPPVPLSADAARGDAHDDPAPLPPGTGVRGEGCDALSTA